MIHPHTELRFINAEIGYGVFCTHFIPKGTITWVRDDLDRALSPTQFAAMLPIYGKSLEKYTFRDAEGNFILCWDLARFMNHSCNPCCIGFGSSFELAIRDIYPGEELTNDYASFNLLPHESFGCSCASPNCRNWISANDVIKETNKWLDLLRGTLPLIKEVPQSLGNLLREEDIHKAISQLSIHKNSLEFPYLTISLNH